MKSLNKIKRFIIIKQIINSIIMLCIIDSKQKEILQ
jgi:hypothetical protein